MSGEGPVESAVAADIARLSPVDAVSGMAVLALALGRAMDRGGGAPVARELRATLELLGRRRPAVVEGDAVDDLLARRTARGA